jgi:hypothetical protein
VLSNIGAGNNRNLIQGLSANLKDIFSETASSDKGLNAQSSQAAVDPTREIHAALGNIGRQVYVEV